MLGRLQRCQLIVKCEMIMYTRGAPDPEFLDLAGSGSTPDPEMLDPAGSGTRPDPNALDPAGSGSSMILALPYLLKISLC